MSKVNTNEKGASVERIGIKHLETAGYNVHRCIRSSRAIGGGRYISHSNDIFGCIDLVAKKADERTRWIQVTSEGGIGEKIAEMRTVPWNTTVDSVELWRWIDGSGNRLDHRNETPRPRLYFQVYHLDDDFTLGDRRIHPPR